MVAIVDYGVGNLFSLRSSFAAIGQQAVATADPDLLAKADRLVLPGVGAFGDASAALRQSGLDKAVLEAAEAGKPLLGICRGIQSINVMLGGTLYQDLPSQLPSEIEHHQTPPYDQPVHEVEIALNTPLYHLLRKRVLSVNSYHHQGIRELSAQLRPMAYAPDGLIEGVYAPGKRYIWAVQWHPELSFRKDDSSKRIFQSFISAAGSK